MSIQLIYSEGSNCAQRVAWALRYKEIEHQVLESETLSESEFLAINPYRKVPCLVVHGQPLAESMAIIEYLEEAFPGRALLPTGIFERAKAREVAELINGTIHAVQNSKVPKFFLPELDEAGVVEQRRRWLAKTLRPLEPLLFQQSAFAVGKAFSLADLFIVPIFARALVVGIRAEDFPKLAAHTRFCLSDATAGASCPPDLKARISKYLPG